MILLQIWEARVLYIRSCLRDNTGGERNGLLEKSTHQRSSNGARHGGDRAAAAQKLLKGGRRHPKMTVFRGLWPCSWSRLDDRFIHLLQLDA